MSFEKRREAPWNLKKIYFGLSTLALLGIAWASAVSGENNLPPLQPLVRMTVLGLYANLFLAYAWLVRDLTPGRPAEWAWMIPVYGALCFMLPVFSGDIMEYLIRGRMLGLYHVNPYRALPIDFPDDLLRPYSIWIRNPDSYGPLSVYLQTPPAMLFPRSIAGMIAAYKGMILAITAVAVVFIYKITRRQTPETYGAGAWKMFAFSPLLIVTACVDGHNDIMMMTFSVVSLYFFFERKYTPAFLFWTAGFLVKYMNVLHLPFLVLGAVRDRWERDGKFPLRFVAGQTVLNLLVIAAAFAPLWAGESTFLAILRQKGAFYNNTFPYVFHLVLTKAGLAMSTDAVKYVLIALYFLGYVLLLVRTWRLRNLESPEFFGILSAAYLGFYAVLYSPIGYWYLIWALPWLVLTRWPRNFTIVLLYSALGLLAFYKRMNFMMPIALAGYLSLLGWDCVRKNPRR